MFYNPFVGNSRTQFTQPQQQQQQYDFSGWGDRLTKIEEGISSLTNQFNNFQPQTGLGMTPDSGLNPQGQTPMPDLGEPLGGLGINNEQFIDPGIIHNQEFIDPGVGHFRDVPAGGGLEPKGASSMYPDPSAPPINLFPSQPEGYQPPGVQPGMGTFNHITDNPYVQGPPDNFITIEGVKYYDDGSTQQAPTAPPQQTQPPQTNYSPGVMPPGWQDVQPFDPNQGIASLAGTNPGI